MRRIICILTTFLFAICMVAQPQKGNRKQFSPEEFEKRMHWFIIEKAGLTQEEAINFFPLLKEMYDAERAIVRNQRKLQKHDGELSEEDYKTIVLNATEMEVKQKQIEQTYYTKKFPKVLSWKKILAVRGAIERFKMEALKLFTPHEGGRPGAGNDQRKK